MSEPLETGSRFVKNMTSGSPYKHMVSFAVPVLISQVFQQIYNTADTYLVGKFLGTEALAAVSSSGNLIFLMISFFVGMGIGGGIVISRSFGAEDYDKVSRAIHSLTVLGVIGSVLLTCAGVLFAPSMLVLMNTDPDILEEAVEYFRIYFAGITTMIMYNMLRSVMNALGNSRHPLYYLIFSSLLNIVLDILFLRFFKWGVWSAAFATCLSQGVSAVLCLLRLCKPGNFYTLSFRKLRLYKDTTIEILRYGIPSGIQNSVISIANTLLQSHVNSFGKYATAGFGIYSKLEGFAFLPINSFTMAISTFVGQNLGANLNQRAKKGAVFGISASAILAEFIGGSFFLAAPKLAIIFDNTPAVIEYVTMNARITSLFFFLLAFSHAVASVCRGAGRAFFPMVVMLTFWCVVRIIYIEITVRMFNDIRLIYWAYPLTWSLSSAAFLIYLIRNIDFSFGKGDRDNETAGRDEISAENPGG